MIHRGTLTFLATIAVASCRPKSTGAPSPSPEPLPPASAASAEPPREATTTPGAPPTLVVADEHGVREVGYDGTVVRTLTKTPAQRPRFVPGGKDIVFYTRPQGELRRISLETGGEHSVAVLPRTFKTCDRMPSYPPGHVFLLGDLDVQGDEDFAVDAAGTRACMTLMDRNANMLNVRIELEIDLSSGVVRHRVQIGGDCTKAKAAWRGCEGAREPPPRAAPFPLASLGEGPELTEEAVAPGARWSVLSVPGDVADYVYRSLFLLDRERKRIFPIVAGPFPAPLAPGEASRNKDGRGTVYAVGETPVRWLGGDALLVGGLLVLPGQRGVDVGGEVAR
jgi:hypothetical protein